MKYTARFFATILMVLLLSVPLIEKARAQESPRTRAKVIYLDGSSIEIENPKFVYEWISWEYSNFSDAPRHQTESPDFHYKEVVRGVELERIIPGDTVTRVELSYSGKPFLRADEVLLTGFVVATRDGKRQTIHELFPPRNQVSGVLLGVTPETLSKPPYPALFQTLGLTGMAVIEGQRGRFYADLGQPPGHVIVLRKEREHEVCQSCKDKSEVVKEIVFLPSTQ